METISGKIIENIIEKLRRAEVELEEFELQLALGKADAMDQYEGMKKELREVLWKIKQEVKDKSKMFDAKMEQLLEILQAGKPEAKETFSASKEKISELLDELLSELKNTGIGAELYATIVGEFGKFKIKMEILRLKLALKKMDWKQEWESGKKEVNRMVQEFEKRVRDTSHTIKEGNEEFFTEIRQAYAHLKKAFSKS